jgi:hypothetical protein
LLDCLDMKRTYTYDGTTTWTCPGKGKTVIKCWGRGGYGGNGNVGGGGGGGGGGGYAEKTVTNLVPGTAYTVSVTVTNTYFNNSSYVKADVGEDGTDADADFPGVGGAGGSDSEGDVTDPGENGRDGDLGSGGDGGQAGGDGGAGGAGGIAFKERGDDGVAPGGGGGGGGQGGGVGGDPAGGRVTIEFYQFELVNLVVNA